MTISSFTVISFIFHFEVILSQRLINKSSGECSWRKSRGPDVNKRHGRQFVQEKCEFVKIKDVDDQCYWL